MFEEDVHGPFPEDDMSRVTTGSSESGGSVDGEAKEAMAKKM